jgi:hypothetical protein
MATAIAQMTKPQIDPKLEQAFARALAEFNKAKSEVEGAENTLAAVTAQYKSECHLQALGKSADPQKYRDSIIRIEQRIVGLTTIAAERQAQLDAAATERSAAYLELEQENQLQRHAALQKRFNDAREAVSAAEGALKRAQQELAAAGHQLKFANLSDASMKNASMKK